MLMLEIAPKAQVSSVSCTGGGKQFIIGGSGGMLPQKIFDICTSQIAGNGPSSLPFSFFHAAC